MADRMDEAKKLVERFKELSYKESECTLGIHDETETKELAELERVIQQLLYSYYLAPQ